MLKLEIFETASITDEDSVFDVQQAEKLRETAYEQGYAAGWQDALEHMRNEDAMRKIASEDALQSISFTYNEAHAALEGAFIALLETLISKILPEMTSLAVEKAFEAEIAKLISDNTRLPVRIMCAPASLETLESLVSNVPGLEIKLVPEESFSEAQVSLTLGAQERVLDFDTMLTRLKEILAQTHQRQHISEVAHG